MLLAFDPLTAVASALSGPSGSSGPWQMGVPWFEVVFRTLVVYLFLVVGLRLAGRRELGQMTIFDLATILVLSNAVQNAMVGADQSLPGGLIAATTLLVVNHATTLLERNNRLARKVLLGSPTLLINNGQWIESHLAKENLTAEEVKQAMREHGVEHASQVKMAVLELDGTISIVPQDAPVMKSRRKVKVIKHE